MKYKLAWAASHPLAAMRRLPKILAERLAGIKQMRRVRQTANLVLMAYTHPNGTEHELIRQNSRRWYGLDGADPAGRERAREFNSDVWLAQTDLFDNGIDVDLGICAVGFKDLRVHCRSDSVVESQIFLRGFYDELTVLELYPQLVTAGSIGIDVGANIGLHTMALAAVRGDASNGRIIAYEPRGSVAERLRNNLTLNYLSDKVVVRNIGLWSRSGRIHFNEDADNFNQGVGRYDPDSRASIEVTSLDADLADTGVRISVIKIDVEGVELQVIQGARKTLQLHRPCILLEYNSPPWTLRQVRHEIPYPVDIIRLPNSLYEQQSSVRNEDGLHGFNNLLLKPS